MQKLVSHKQLGSKVAYDVTLDGGVLELSPKHSVNTYNIALDRDVTIDLLADNVNIGDTVNLVITTDGSARTITWGDNAGGVPESNPVDANKTVVASFFYTGANGYLATNLLPPPQM